MKNEPLAWYIAGPLIGLMVPLLLILKEKQFGVSSTYRYLISLVIKKPKYFNYSNTQDAWQIYFSIGLVITGLIYNLNNYDMNILNTIGSNSDFQVPTISFYSLNNWALFLFGGVLIGFGSRYSNGCTAGHCIMGLSQFAPSSLIATIGFFIGGLIMAYILNPILLNY